MPIFEGYHGTDASCFHPIKKNNFQLSESFDEWIGYGVYFFVAGISDPIENAKTWAEAQAWDNQKKEYKYQYCCVIYAQIQVKNILDLTCNDGLIEFNRFRDALIDRYIEYRKNNPNGHTPNTHDCYVYNAIAEAMELDAILKNLYIKDTKKRINKLNSRAENTTVLCIKSAGFIDKTSITNHNTFEVNEYEE